MGDPIFIDQLTARFVLAANLSLADEDKTDRMRAKPGRIA
jgi:hypothetical protein